MQCRACLTSSAKEYLDMHSNMTDDVTFYDIFTECTQINASSNDGLPSTLCLSCGDHMEIVHQFLQVARYSNKILCENLRSNFTLKSEAEYIEEDCEGLVEDGENGVEPKVEYMEIETIEPNELEEFVSLECNAKSATAKSNENESRDVIYYGDFESDEEYLKEYIADSNTTNSANKWKCVVCKFTFSGDVSYEGHMNMHKGIRPYKCASCDSAFRCKKKLDRHVLIKHAGQEAEELLSCSHCLEIFETHTALNEHIEKMHDTAANLKSSFYTEDSLPSDENYENLEIYDESEFREDPEVIEEFNINTNKKKYRCTICKKDLESATQLQEHLKTHLNDTRCECKLCSKLFSSAVRLKSHMQIKHPEECSQIENERVESCVAKCKLCRKTLLKKNLERHMAVHKKKETEQMDDTPKYLCAYCPREFRNQKAIKQHEKCHIGQKPDIVYLCVECNRSYNTQYLLDQHRKQAHKERDYTCNICGNAFKLKNQLVNHMKLHLEKNIQCPHCDKKYARTFDLNVHMRTHTGELPFACHLCDKRFAIKVRLTYHLQKHMGIKHPCKECGAEFNSKQKLKAHSFKHTGMPYRCQMCDDHGFPNRDIFKRHLLKVHNTTMSDEQLVEMFQRNTGKTTRIRTIDELENFVLSTEEMMHESEVEQY